MSTRVMAVGRTDLVPFTMSDRFKHEITYFMSIPGEHDVPAMGPGEYWVSLAEAREWLESGVFRLVSPLDSENKTEVELSEEQEAWLEWMVEHQVQHVRLA
ncbi:MAG TPA: hypothetical protein VHV55_14485 [Pirellulales bacterium]|nr:hypothetical protein [Pirellulales bacterium]